MAYDLAHNALMELFSQSDALVFNEKADASTTDTQRRNSVTTITVNLPADIVEKMRQLPTRDWAAVAAKIITDDVTVAYDAMDFKRRMLDFLESASDRQIVEYMRKTEQQPNRRPTEAAAVTTGHPA
jgi:hypothetical protein